MVLDYFPESPALGGMFAIRAKSAPVLALMTSVIRQRWLLLPKAAIAKSY